MDAAVGAEFDPVAGDGGVAGRWGAVVAEWWTRRPSAPASMTSQIEPWLTITRAGGAVPVPVGFVRGAPAEAFEAGLGG
ncbi:hypothetical protein GCM10020254_85570 [Streptomyces goshikiensis]